jgi:hypothetical protein
VSSSASDPLALAASNPRTLTCPYSPAEAATVRPMNGVLPPFTPNPRESTPMFMSYDAPTGTEAADGFANRFLWFCVERSKLLPEGGALHEVDCSEEIAHLRRALEFARDPRVVGVLTRDAAAKELWAQVYPELSAGRACSAR